MWTKLKAWLPAVLAVLGLVVGWWLASRRRFPAAEVEEELAVAKARVQAAEVVAEKGVTAAKAAVIAEHEATVAKLDAEQANEADKLAHGDPAALAEFLVRAARR